MILYPIHQFDSQIMFLCFTSHRFIMILIAWISVVSEDCSDNSTHCDSWAKSGECSRNPAYMLETCKRSCKQCGMSSMFDSYSSSVKSFLADTNLWLLTLIRNIFDRYWRLLLQYFHNSQKGEQHKIWKLSK